MPRTPAKISLTVNSSGKSDEEIVKRLAIVGQVLMDEYYRINGEHLADKLAREKAQREKPDASPDVIMVPAEDASPVATKKSRAKVKSSG